MCALQTILSLYPLASHLPSSLWRFNMLLHPLAFLHPCGASTYALQIEIRADDLPREAVERLEVCAKHTALLDLVAAKDRILLQLIRERDELLSQVQQLEQGETELEGARS